jgi:hypothetical protein
MASKVLGDSRNPMEVHDKEGEKKQGKKQK